MNLEEKLKEIPTSPGVYLHKDDSGRILYIGKAKNLRSRVRQYFQAGQLPQFGYDIKTRELVRQIADVEFIVTDNEVGALILEATLVKQHQPRFNYKLKDDKSYPHLKLTINEPFPKVVITRRIQRDGALYFGPFLPASLARKTIDVINRTFQLRTCDIEINGKAPRPCLEYHIKRCLGPCVKGLCTPAEYQEAVRDVRLLLEGRNTELANQLEQRMIQASEGTRYELAAKYRDLRKTVIKLSEQQKMATTSESDLDIFGYYREGKRLALQLFTMREGDIVGRREFFWEDLPENDFNPAEFLSEVLAQYYSGPDDQTRVPPVDTHAQDARATQFVPREIHVPIEFDDRELLEKALSERRGRRVHISAPQRGEKRDMIDLVEKNAKLAFEQRFRVLKPDMKRVLEEMQETLELPRFPARIESFDVSHIQGAENVAGMVVCENGKMNRSEYRKFKIRWVEGANDFASMHEAVLRRYRRVRDEEKALPDLIMIDGGKGQLSAAAEAMRELDLEAVPMVGIVKPPLKHNQVSYLLVKGREHEPIYLDPHSLILRLLQMIRDETHRYALSYHRKRRLLRHFGSIQRIAAASAMELTPFVGKKTAQEIEDHFARQRSLVEGATV